MNRIALAIAIALGGALFPSLCFAVGLVISPVQLGLAGPPGATVSGVISVSAPRVQEATVRVTFAEYLVTDEGIRVEKPQNHERSCVGWLDTDQQQFASTERSAVQVVVTAHIPKDAAGSYWAAARFAAVPPPVTEDSKKALVGLRIVPQLSIPVIVTVTGTEKPDLQIVSLDARREGADIEATVEIENRGNVAVLVAGAVTVESAASDGTAEELASADITNLTSFPGLRRKVRMKLHPSSIARDAEVHAYLRFGGSNEVLERSMKIQTSVRGE